MKIIFALGYVWISKNTKEKNVKKNNLLIFSFIIQN